MSWWQDKLHQLSSDSYLTRNKSHSTHSRDATRRIPPLIQRVHHFPPDLRVKEPRQWVLASSVLYVSQFSLSAMSNSLWPHGLQHTRLPWPSPTLKLMSIESVVPSNHLILCHPLLLLPSVFPSIGVFFSESVLCIRWPKYWSFIFSISFSHQVAKLLELQLQHQSLQSIFRVDFL